MSTRPGDIYDQNSLERDFNALWNSGFFEDVRFEREESPKGYRIHVYVKEKDTIRTIEYKGLSSVSQSDVQERYKKLKVGLTPENQYDPTKVKRAEVVLKELLAEHGRQFATVRTEVRKIPPAAVGITFLVKEGPKVKVGKIRFDGNQHLSGRVLRAAMKNSKPIGIPHSIFLENVFARTFDATKLSEDAERVRLAYQQRGYYKALVEDPKTQLRDVGGGLRIPLLHGGKGKRVDIVVSLEEGSRYRLAAITFKGGKEITNTKALRGLFAIKDGDIFNVEMIRKGLESLRKAYGELGFINFTAVPDTRIDEEKKLITLDIDLDEGKKFYVRRIEFKGNTTTRDKVIRRELALEEGQVYNSRMWEFSLLRLNQLGYFEQLKPEEDSETKRNEQEATVDLLLKVKEKGKNSIGLTGGVSGLAGSFIGINYETNNFLGLGETLRVEADVGSRERNVLFGFTEPYLFDRPIQFGFTVFSRRFSFNQALETQILLNQRLNLPQNILNTLQDFNQSSTGFTLSGSYQLRRSLKRVGLTYSFDTTSVNVFSDASRSLFEQIAFRGVSGQNALKGIVTSKVLPSFSFSSIDYPQRPHSGKSLFLGGDVAGLAGNVNFLRPLVEYKQFKPFPHESRNTLGYRVQAAFITGWAGNVAPPFERFYMGGDTDLRGFDIRSLSPIVFLADKLDMVLTNPDGTPVPKDPTNPRRGSVTVPVPIQRIVFPGGDTNFVTNLEYRIPIVGPVVLAIFSDFGMNFVTRSSQLRLSDVQLNTLNSTSFGCPALDASFNCAGGLPLGFKRTLSPVAGTNYVPRLSTGLELQVILPFLNNAPFRIYYAYNPLLLDKFISTPSQITRDMFPPGGAGDFTFRQAQASFAPDFRLKEPSKTFRFTVSTTF